MKKIIEFAFNAITFEQFKKEKFFETYKLLMNQINFIYII